VFFGDVTTVGQVVGASSEPVAAAEVICRPSAFRPEYEATQWDRFRTHSDEQGVFRFDALPTADTYKFTAFAGYRYATLRLRASDLRRAKIRLVLHEIGYERYLFFDESGEPVDVRGILRPLFGRRLLWKSRSPSLWARRQLEALGLTVPPVRANDVITVYGRGGVPGVRGRDGIRSYTHRIRVPGYAEIQLAAERRPGSDWPRGTRVVLHPDPGTARDMVRYEVEIPDLDHLAGAWREVVGSSAPAPRLSLVLRRMPEKLVNFVDLNHSIFFAPPESQFEVGQHPFSPLLPYDKVDRDGGVLIRPSYPEFAMVVLHCEVPPHGPAAGDLVVSTRLGECPVYAESAYPGKALFGPLPVGEYTFERTWRNLRDPIPTDSFGPVRVEGGVHELRWR
jgi:hypothetical protein